MKILSEYLRLLVFLSGLLLGIQVPGFIDQYGDNLRARLEESSRSVGEFQDDADRYFDGDLDKLVAYYSANSDPVFVSGGESIDTLVARNRLLTEALNNFTRSWYSPYTHVLFGPVDDIRSEAWSNYDYRVTLSGYAILAGLLSGLACAIAMDLIAFGAVRLTRRVRSGRKLAEV